MEKNETPEKNLPEKTEQTRSHSARFAAMITNEYKGALSAAVEMTPLRGKLAQHLFVKIDMALKEAEAKRNPASNKVPYSWAKINMQKAALSAVHRIELGLDGLIPNHIWPIAYYNNRAGVYDLDLRIGYAGKDYYYRKMALYPILDIIYELVHANDKFTVIKKSINEGVESYTFEIPKPFDRGPVVGGFGYIMYQNSSLNRLVIVDQASFTKSQDAAKNNNFWTKHPDEMKYKTIVHRTVKSIVLDPEKINESFGQVEADEIASQDRDTKGQAQAEVDENANSEFIDITPDGPEPNMTEEEKAEIRAQEIPDPLDKEQRKPAF